MSTTDILEPDDYLPAPPVTDRWGIGVVGLGGVARNAHIPSYRALSLHVVGGADLDPKARQFAADKFGIDAVATHEELLANPAVGIVDVALPNTVPVRSQIIHDAIDAGKHVLVQKPFAYDYDTALAMVEHAERAGVRLAVNQNGRWNPSYRAASALLERGFLGYPYFLSHEMCIDQDSPNRPPWVLNLKRSVIVEYSVHHLDIVRKWAGRTAHSVQAITGRRPNQHSAGDLIATIGLQFDGAVGNVVDNTASVGEAPYCRFRIDGTEGTISGTVGAWPGGTGRGPGTIEVVRRGAHWAFRPDLAGSWAIDAFGATMSDLINAIEADTEPEASGRDNLETLKTVFAAELSAETGRRVEI
jgi:predicted dehydrogenase